MVIESDTSRIPHVNLFGVAEDFFTFHDLFVELDKEYGLARPHLATSLGGSVLIVFAHAVRRNTGEEAASITDTLDDAGDIGCTVQLIHLFGDADVGVDQWIVIRDHVLVFVIL